MIRKFHVFLNEYKNNGNYDEIYYIEIILIIFFLTKILKSVGIAGKKQCFDKFSLQN